jgi:2-dehydro-3-deoxygluconokinase
MNTPNTPRIALIGECMIELQHRADGSLQQSFGGDTLNTAVYLARELGERGAVDYVTALGDDSFSDAMCRSWAEENIGLDRVQRLPGRLPGLYCIQTDANGERRFLYWRNEAAVRDCFTTPSAVPILKALPDYDVLYFSGITLAVLGAQGRAKLLEVLIDARLRDARIVFDNNYRPRLWASIEEARATYRSVLPYIDLALLTVDDEQALFHFADCDAVFAARGGAQARRRGVPDSLWRRVVRGAGAEGGAGGGHDSSGGFLQCGVPGQSADGGKSGGGGRGRAWVGESSDSGAGGTDPQASVEWTPAHRSIPIKHLHQVIAELAFDRPVHHP